MPEKVVRVIKGNKINGPKRFWGPIRVNKIKGMTADTRRIKRDEAVDLINRPMKKKGRKR